MVGPNDTETFQIEWRIENFTCWNKKVHPLCISTNNLRLGGFIFDFSLFPMGFSGKEEFISLRFLDESASYGELQILSGDKSQIFYVIDVTSVRKDDFLILSTLLRFRELNRLITDNPSHIDSLILLYNGERRRTSKQFQYVHLKSKIDCMDMRYVLLCEYILRCPSEKIVLGDMSSSRNGEVHNFKISCSFAKATDDTIGIYYRVEPDQIAVETSVKSSLYLIDGSNYSCVASKNHICTNNQNYEFCATLLLQQLRYHHVNFRVKVVMHNQIYSQGVLSY